MNRTIVLGIGAFVAALVIALSSAPREAEAGFHHSHGCCGGGRNYGCCGGRHFHHRHHRHRCHGYRNNCCGSCYGQSYGSCNGSTVIDQGCSGGANMDQHQPTPANQGGIPAPPAPPTQPAPNGDSPPVPNA